MDRRSLEWRRAEYVKMLSRLESEEIPFFSFGEDQSGELVRDQSSDPRGRRIAEVRERIAEIDCQLGATLDDADAMLGSRIDLSRLRVEVRPDFEKWQVATERFWEASRSAKRARRDIGDKARAFLAKNISFAGSGLYLYLDERAKSLAEAVVYVGLVKKRAGSHRMHDYLVKQLSVLEEGLVGTPEEVMRMVRQRVKASMPETSGAVLGSYVREHMKSVRLSIATAILFHETERGADEIEAAETLLIRSLVQLAPGGRVLVNRSKVSSSWPPHPDCLRGRELAVAAIENWSRSGLSAALGKQWELCLQTGCDAAAH